MQIDITILLHDIMWAEGRKMK